MGEEMIRIERVSRKALEKIEGEIEKRLEEALAEKIREIKAEYAEKSAEEKRRALEDGDRMMEDDKNECKEKADERIRALREKAEKDDELLDLRERQADAERRTKDKEDLL